MSEDPLAPARGILIGLVLGLAAWGLILSVWVVLR
jgi:hypothetical protein